MTRLRIDGFVDHGSVVQLVGHDLDTDRFTIIGFDRRPFEAFWLDWHAAGRPNPVAFDPDLADGAGAITFD